LNFVEDTAHHLSVLLLYAFRYGAIRCNFLLKGELIKIDWFISGASCAFVQAHVHGDEGRSKVAEPHGHQHDGRRLPRRPADKGRVFNHRALEIASVNRQPARHSRNHEIKIQSINYQIVYVFMFGIQKTSNKESK